MRSLLLPVLLTLLLSVLSWTGCSRCPRPSTPVPPPPAVTVSPSPVPCALPPWPEGQALGLVPIDDGARFVAERERVESLVTHLARLRQWMAAAAVCVEARR